MTKRLRQDDGIALVMALGITVVLIIMIAAMISYTSQGSRNSNVSRSRLTAHTISESGIATAASIVNKAANAADPALLGCTANGLNSALPCTDISVAVPGGTAYLHGMYSQVGNTGTWTVTSYGSVRNPTGSANLTKMVTATMSLTGGGQSNNISVWNYVYATAPAGSGCEVTITGNNAIVKVPVYITGDLCLNAGGAGIREDTANGGQPVDVRVGGVTSFADASASVGTSAKHITSGISLGGCKTVGSAHPCTSADGWWVNQADAWITATPPVVDMAFWYTNASPGPKNACGAGTPSPVLSASSFDSDTTMNGTTGQFDLTGGSSYNCVTPTGTLSWSTATKKLTISGTIFFDGPVMSSNTAAYYVGKATIYVNGTFSMSTTNGSLMAGCPSANPTRQCLINTTGEWDPNINNLMIISGKTSGNGVALTGPNSKFQGGLLCPPTSTADLTGDTVSYEGPLICGKFLWGNGMTIFPLPTVTNLPPGAPVPPNAPATIGLPVITRG
jgi:Tfp pilus assembly protein PilX